MAGFHLRRSSTQSALRGRFFAPMQICSPDCVARVSLKGRRNHPLFFGPHQGGIATAQQTNSYFVAFDLLAKTRDEMTAMLRLWTEAAARMTSGETARPLGEDLSIEGPDGASALGLAPARLTITFGFGAGLFMKDGVDRYGLAAKRPEALVDLPKFNGDQLQPARTGGDISVQAWPTTRWSRFTRCGNSIASAMARRRSVGRRRVSCLRRRPAKRRAT